MIGAGFAGLSAAVRLAGSGARVLVLEARSRLGGRATAFADRETGELVDNGQHVLLGCYTDTFAFLAAIGALDNVRGSRSSASRWWTWKAAGRVSSVPRCPRRFICSPGILDWDALSWRDKWSVLGMATPLKLARRELRPGARSLAASPGETVENWLVRNGQTARIRELLWDPLALAALNQPPDQAAAPPFARVLAEMFGDDPRAAAIALPTKPLHLMYAEPARAYIERRGGVVKTGVAATVRLSKDGVHTGERGPPGMGRAVGRSPPCRGSRFPSCSTMNLPPSPTSFGAPAPWLRVPIVTVNMWFDRPVLDEPFIGLPGRAMQWVFDKRAVFGGEASHLSLVSSGASRVAGLSNAELVHLATGELLEALPAVRDARLLRAAVVREPRATFSLAPGQPARPGSETPVAGLVPGRRLDPDGPARYDRVRGPLGTQVAASLAIGTNS